MTVEQARSLAGKLNVAIAGGANPQAAKRERRGEPTIGDLWKHWLTHAEGRKRPRSIEEDERLWRLHLSPWAGRKVSAVRPQDVAGLHRRLGENAGR